MEGTVFGYFSKTVERFPNRDFQRIKDRKTKKFHGVTYQEVYDQVLQIGTGLMSFGVRKGDKVGVICDNRPEWIPINLALQGIGAPDVPRDTEAPLPQLEKIIEDSEPSAIIFENEKTLNKLYDVIEEKFPHVRTMVVIEKEFKPRKGVCSLEDVIHEGKALLGKGSKSFLEAAKKVSPNDVSTVVYTSGTQGIPKGTIITHSNFAHIFDVAPPILELNENDRALSLLPPWHLFERVIDYVVLAIGGALSYTNSKDALEDMGLENPTFFASVPRVWMAAYERAMKKIRKQRHPLDEILENTLEKAIEYKKALNTRNGRYPGTRRDEGKLSRMKSLRQTLSLNHASYMIAEMLIFSTFRKMLGGNLKGAIFGGGHLPQHVEDFLDAASVNVLEGYGMTEAAPLVTLRSFGGTLYTAGKPIPGTEIKIVDEYLNEVPIGEKGVIYVRGPQIMKGYTSPELTSRVLSLSADGNQLKWFNTGDFGLMTYDGNLKVLGRVGDDFKLVNGEWVIPQPIEDAICTSKYVQDVMLLGADQKFVGALIFPEWGNLRQYAKEHGIQYPDDDPANLVLSKDSGIKELIKKEVGALVSPEKGFTKLEQPTTIAIIGQELRQGFELTATEKLRRDYIKQEYSERIDELFR